MTRMFSVFSIIISTTFLLSIIARGYIPQFDNGLKITATGLLSANSIPKNAKVIINEKLYTTTDDSINLVPSDYQLQIIKDGYLPWTKKINIQKEMVYQAEASLFRKNPILSAVIIPNAFNSTASSDLTQIVYINSGIYLIETNYLSSILGKYQPKLISPNPFGLNDKTATIAFSSNGKQLILKSTLKKNIYSINIATGTISQSNNKTDTIDISPSTKLPEIFTATIATNPASIAFSGDENKFLYLLNDQYQVYDIEKNLNYILNNSQNIENPFWLPKSNSIIYTNAGQIKSIEFDGTNSNTIYSGEFIAKSLIPQFDGEKILISVATKSSLPESIYSLTIR